MNTIYVNGQSFTVSGNSITISDNSVYVDGKLVQSELKGIVEIKFEGSLASLKCHNATIEGNIIGPVDCHNLQCKDVHGDIDAHNVSAKSVTGNIKAKNFS